MPEKPRNFGKYILGPKIGAGGFGEVFMGYDPALQRNVAIKVLHQGLMNDRSFLDRARREMGLVGQINHPNVVKVYEVSEIEGRMCIIMEYIDGVSLGKRLESGEHFPVGQCLTIIEQVAQALAATHAHKIVHRDVKAENILIDRNGNIHLVDFGLAHAAQSSLGSSSTAIGMGTAKSMSPEQAAGQIGDQRSDVYSLGVLAYQLWVGRPPFQETTLLGYITAHKDKQPPDPCKINPTLSRPVQQVLLRALAKKPGERYKSAPRFAAELARAVEQPEPSGGLKPALLIGLLAVVGIVGLLGGLYALNLPPFAAPAATLTLPLPLVATLTPGKATVTTAPTSVPATSTSRPPGTAQPPAPSPTGLPSASATLGVTPTVPPATPTQNTPTGGDLPVLQGSGVEIIPGMAGSTRAGQGQIVFRLRNGLGQPVVNRYVRVYSQKKNLAGGWVVDREVNGGYTDNGGIIRFDLNPGAYIVGCDAAGYNWGSAQDVEGQADVAVSSGKITQVTVSLSRLMIGFLRADQSVVSNQYVRVFSQKKDISGRWVVDREELGGYTDNTGAINFDLAPGYYTVQTDFPGYNWGNAADVEGMASVPLAPGQEKSMIVKLGQIRVGLLDQQNKPVTGKYMRIYTQKASASGSPVTDQEVSGGYTDNAGMIVFNLTPGKYALAVNDTTLWNVQVLAGQITTTDGKTFQVQTK